MEITQSLVIQTGNKKEKKIVLEIIFFIFLR